MNIEVGIAAIIAHVLLMVVGGVLHVRLVPAFERGDAEHEGGHFFLSFLYHALPTLTLSCTIYSWVASSHDNLLAGYCFVAFPWAVAVLMGMSWMCQRFPGPDITPARVRGSNRQQLEFISPIRLAAEDLVAEDEYFHGARNNFESNAYQPTS